MRPLGHSEVEIPAEILLPRLVLSHDASGAEPRDQPPCEVIAEAPPVDEVGLGLRGVEVGASERGDSSHVLPASHLISYDDFHLHIVALVVALGSWCKGLHKHTSTAGVAARNPVRAREATPTIACQLPRSLGDAAAGESGASASRA